MFSINVDWSNMGSEWENIGRTLIVENCKHKDEENQSDYNMRYKGSCEKCGFCEDSCIPMMNYAYPLETTPEEKDILKVCQETNLTVMYNNEEDKYYLVLCGGGMDLSQEIALAYNILEKWIPLELALQVSTQDGLNVSGKKFRQVMRACKESIKKDMDFGRERLKKINLVIKESILKDKK